MKTLKVKRPVSHEERQDAPEGGLTPIAALAAVRDAVRRLQAASAQWDEYLAAERGRRDEELAGLQHTLESTAKFMLNQPGVRAYLDSQLAEAKTKTVKIAGVDVQYGTAKKGGNAVDILDEDAAIRIIEENIAAARAAGDNEQVSLWEPCVKKTVVKNGLKCVLKSDDDLAQRLRVLDVAIIQPPTEAPVFKVADLDITELLEADDE